MELPKEAKKMKPILTTDEIKQLMYEVFKRDHTWKHVWAVAVLTGMRSGELHALKWSDVDFENNLIRITKSFSQRLGAIKTTKNSDVEFPQSVPPDFRQSVPANFWKKGNWYALRVCKIIELKPGIGKNIKNIFDEDRYWHPFHEGKVLIWKLDDEGPLFVGA